MHHCDASSIIHGWETYPLTMFPRLWDWVEEQLHSNALEISRPAMEEVRHVSPDCACWLDRVQAPVCPVNNPIMQRARTLKGLLGIVNDNYHPDGVDENDILIIAAADYISATLISDEAKQPTLPLVQRRYKIPAVCSMSGSPPCITFIEYIRSARRSFG